MSRLKLLILIVILIFAVISLLYFNRVQYKTRMFKGELLFNAAEYNHRREDTIVKSLDEKEKDKASMIEVKQIHTGDLKVPLSNALNIEYPTCIGLEDKAVEVPIFAYLVHHEKYGNFLIDTGCDASFVNNPYGSIKGILVSKFVPKTTLKSENAIEEQLAEVKQSIKGVFFTHLHPDHTAGLKGLPDNLIYVAGMGEESVSYKFLLEIDHFKREDIINLLDFNSEKAFIHPIGTTIDIFGDKSLLAISTPGHTKGHVSYLVNTEKNPILIAGDACILNKSLETGAGPGTSSADTKLAQETFDKINDFIKKNPLVKVWPGHDFPK